MLHGSWDFRIGWTTAPRRALGLALICAALLVALGAPGSPGAQAAPSAGIVVNDLGDNATAGDMKCTLREAINNANANSDTTGGDCAAGSGADSISFSVSGTIVLSSTLGTLPAINDNLTMDGTGQSLTISGNDSVQALVVNSGKTLNLTALTFASGVAASNCGGFPCGGAIFNQGTLAVSNSTFNANGIMGAGEGGAIYNAGTLNVTYSTFNGNAAVNGGGGIYNTGALTVTHSTFSGNAVAFFGGAIHNSGTLNVTNSTFSGNIANSSPGGGIANSGTLNVTNSTFSGNYGTLGGGLYNTGTLNVTNSTFSGNTAFSGGGIGGGGGSTTLTNTIVANSTSGANCFGSITDGGHNLRWPNTDSSCVGAFGDPKLGPLANNGGATQTMALGAGSAAIDAGDDTVCTAPPVNNLDQRGKLRTQGAHCDIGAYEADERAQSGPNFVVTRTTDHDDGVCGEVDCTLREAINAANAHGGADTITFSVSGTILLGATLPAINDDVNIDGTGQSITVSGGGAVQVMVINGGKTVTLNGLTIANGYCHSTNGTYCFGGGIASSGTLTVTNSTVRGNATSCTGGFVCFAYGGGIYNGGGTLTVANSTFSGNSTTASSVFAFGGAIYNAGTLNATNSTFSGNSAGSAGGGIFNGGTATLHNSIVANSPAGGDCANSGTLTADSHNLADDNTCGSATQKTSVQIALGALQDNGGPSWTMALGPTSAAIDAGDDAVCAAAPISGKDQRGVTRPQSAHCDSGAYERNISSETGPNFVVNSSADTDDGFCDLLGQGLANKDCTLREALNAANAHSGADSTTFNIPSMTGCTAANVCTIALTTTLPVITETLSLDGSANAASITVSGNNAVRVFNAAAPLTISTLTIQNGNTAGSGGGLYTTSPVTLAQVVFLSNTAALAGGGLYAGSTATLNGAAFQNNQCSALGCLSQDWYAGGALSLAKVVTSTGSIQNQGPTSQAAGGVIVFTGSAGQVITGGGSTTFDQMWLNNTGGGVWLGQNLTVTNRLTLTGDLTTTTGYTLSLGANATTSGSGDVWGRTLRAHAFTLNTPYAFGSPFVSLNFLTGTVPSAITVDLTRTLPLSFANAIERVYQIEPVGGSGYVARLRLHYRDSELNGNQEGTLQLWRYSPGGPWTPYTATAFDATDNWVERSDVSALSLWTLSQYFPISRRLYLPALVYTPIVFP